MSISINRVTLEQCPFNDTHRSSAYVETRLSEVFQQSSIGQIPIQLEHLTMIYNEPLTALENRIQTMIKGSHHD